MKKFIWIIVAVVVVSLIAWAIWAVMVTKNSQSTNSITSLPPVQSQTQSGASVPVQSIPRPQDPVVAKNFLSDIQNADQIALGGTVIASPYALQIWGDVNKGGEALLEQSSSTGWKLISLGGGEWSVLALVQEGVPVAAAEQLVAGLTSGSSTPSIAPPIAIPPGNTISIGTSNGVVTMNNFYNHADYISQDQQAVVVQGSSTYSIVYNIPDSSFTLTIIGSPFDIVRQVMETVFLNSLGISQQDACKLLVSENVPGDSSNQYAGQTFRLSFCSSAVQ